jgi:hypothetical protein
MGNNAAADMLLCFLPHFCQQLDGKVVKMAPDKMNPGFLTTTGATFDPGLQAILDARIPENPNSPLRQPQPTSGGPKGLRFALVDLTEDVCKPKFAGHRVTEQGGCASMAKLACMYAAFQLKFDLEQLSEQNGLSTADALFKQPTGPRRKEWADAQHRDASNVTSLFPSDPKVELFGRLLEIHGLVNRLDQNGHVHVPPPFESPDLEEMFNVAASASGKGVSLRFIGNDRILVGPEPSSPVPSPPPHTNKKVDDAVRFGHTIDDLRSPAKDFSFSERLFLMIDDSDNAAASTCTNNVSFLYIASALMQSGIYSLDRGGGLWEGGDHFGFHWVKPFVPQKALETDFISGTAVSFAALLTLIAQDRLVNPEASSSMRHLMSRTKVFPPGLDHTPPHDFFLNNGSYNTSFFKQGLKLFNLFREGVTSPQFTPDEIFSKIGIGTSMQTGAELRSESALVVRRDRLNKDAHGADIVLKYVIVGFDDTNHLGALLAALALGLDQCIRANNGIPTITPVQLPAVNVNVGYSQQLEEMGGTGPFKWSIPVGDLPDGLTLNPTSGLISGTPTVPNIFFFTVQVIDSTGKIGRTQFDIDVKL